MLINNTGVLKKFNTSVVCVDNTFVLGFDTMNLTYGQRLKAARKNKKLSQTDLAEISGVGQGSISKIERGDQESSAYDIELSHHLGVNPMWLKTGDENLAPDWITGKGEKSKEPRIKEAIEPGEIYQPVRFVSFDLKAGISGYGVDYLNEENEPLYLRATWFQKRRLKPANIVACSVSGESMEPTLYSGDVVLVDLSNTTLIDGDVFAVNYEGEMLIKRMHRDAGQWYLQSDNPNKTHYPNKLCSGDLCLIIGKVVHRQSEKI